MQIKLKMLKKLLVFLMEFKTPYDFPINFNGDCVVYEFSTEHNKNKIRLDVFFMKKNYCFNLSSGVDMIVYDKIIESTYDIINTVNELIKIYFLEKEVNINSVYRSFMYKNTLKTKEKQLIELKAKYNQIEIIE